MKRLRALTPRGRTVEETQRFEQDAKALVRIIEHKQEQLGVEFWLPPLQQARLVLVTEEEEKITGGLVFSDLTEMTMVGDEASMVRDFMDHEGRIRMALNRAGCENLITFLPKCLMKDDRKSGMQRIVERLKFRLLDERFSTFEGEVYGA